MYTSSGLSEHDQRWVRFRARTVTNGQAVMAAARSHKDQCATYSAWAYEVVAALVARVAAEADRLRARLARRVAELLVSEVAELPVSEVAALLVTEVAEMRHWSCKLPRRADAPEPIHLFMGMREDIPVLRVLLESRRERQRAGGACNLINHAGTAVADLPHGTATVCFDFVAAISELCDRVSPWIGGDDPRWSTMGVTRGFFTRRAGQATSVTLTSGGYRRTVRGIERSHTLLVFDTEDADRWAKEQGIGGAGPTVYVCSQYSLSPGRDQGLWLRIERAVPGPWREAAARRIQRAWFRYLADRRARQLREELLAELYAPGGPMAAAAGQRFARSAAALGPGA